MKLSQDLQISLSVALNDAAHRRHEVASLEHLFFALLHDETTTRLIRDCGGDVDGLRSEVDEFLQSDHFRHRNTRWKRYLRETYVDQVK